METFRRLVLDDKTSFDQLLRELQPETSDLTFTNLFMWQYSYGLQVMYDHALDYWILWADPPNAKWKKFFLPPVGDWNNLDKLREVFKIMEKWAVNQNFEFLIRRAPKRLFETLSKIEPNLIAKEERRTFDYLYNSSDLINLAGRKYHGKRNHLNQFLRKYQWEYSKLNQELVQECLDLKTDWFDIKKRPGKELTDEERAMARVLDKFAVLRVVGGVIKIEGKIQALAVGERLNSNTAVIHIEKANIEYDGMYTAINQQFAANCWSEYEFINREEDMGIEGLRKAKLSYKPVKLVEKFSIQY